VTNLEDIVARLVSRLVGCRVAAVAAMDGLLVERYPGVADGPEGQQLPGAAELEHVAADLTTSLTLLAGEISRQLGSRVDELIALGDSGGYLARRIGDDLFCFVIVNATADLGNVRREVEAVSRELAVVFA
jgi:predicted regulator of Ras-like GTPase activity (Roadblock/LC7/MglB family)